MSVNPVASHCIATGSLDQHIRLFDVRTLRTMTMTNTAPYNYKMVEMDDLNKVHSNAQIGSYQASKACTSVDFSPNGDRLVGVTYDDKIKGTSIFSVFSSIFRIAYLSDTVSCLPVWDTDPSHLEPAGKAATPKKASKVTGALANEVTITHNNQSGKWITILRARWNRNPALPPHFSVSEDTRKRESVAAADQSRSQMGGMNRRAEIFSADGTLLRALYDEDHVTAVPAVTAMHPGLPGRLVTGNASGRCTFWA